MRRRNKLLASFFVALFGLSCTFSLGVSAANSFSDVNGHWAKNYIKEAVEHGYINGYANKTFQPNGSVTRAEFCKMLNRSLGITVSSTVDFQDVPSNQWYFSEVQKAVAAGYISGYNDQTFRANAPITRQEAAVILSRIITSSNTTKEISDLKDHAAFDAWAMQGAKTVFSKNYMSGDPQKNFKPKGKLSRAEAVKIVETVLSNETIKHADVTVSSPNQLHVNTIYTGKVNVRPNGSASENDTSFTNCRILGTLQMNKPGTIRLSNTRVSTLTVDHSSGEAEIIASGNSALKQTTLSGDCSLDESGLIGEGFQDVSIKGNNIRNESVDLSGVFDSVSTTAPSKLRLTWGSIKQLNLASGAKGSKIDLASKTTLEKADIYGASDFSGKGSIYRATLHVNGSTFETAPLTLEGKSALLPSIYPANGASNVSISDSIRISFNEKLYNSSKNSLSNRYIESSVIELRKNSSNGTKISFRASHSSNDRIITITPKSKLSKDTKYYVILKPALKNRDGVSNQKQTFSFTTVGGLIPESYPVNGSDNIPVTSKITLHFDRPIYQANGSALTNTYLTDTAIELWENYRHSSDLSFSASISSDKKTITLTPKRTLSTSTKYYVVLKDDTLANNDGILNHEQTIAFSTANSKDLVPVIDPPSNSTSVDVNTNIDLTFDTSVYTSSGTALTSSYLTDRAFTLRKGSTSGSSVSLTASIRSSKKVITLTPKYELRGNTTYYLILDSDRLCDGTGSNRNYNERQVFNFTTASEDARSTLEPTPYPKNGAHGVGTGIEMTLSFDEDLYQATSSKSKITASYLQSKALELRKGSSTGEKVAFTATFDEDNHLVTLKPKKELTPNTRYYIILKDDTIQNNSERMNSRFSSYFTCGSNNYVLRPSVSPEDGVMGISPTTSISLYFSESLYDSAGNYLSNNDTGRSYLQKTAIELRAKTETGSKVAFTVDSIGSRGNVRLIPDKPLTDKTTYFIVLPEGKLRNSDSFSNRKQVFRFTVGSGLEMTVSPKNGDTNIKRTSSITLNFNEKVYRSNYEELTNSNISSYMTNVAELKKGSTPVPFTASISSSSRAIYIKPNNPMEPNTKYTFTIPANKLANYAGSRNSELSLSFTTTGMLLKPTITPSTGSSGVSVLSDITLDFEETLYNSTGSLLTKEDVQDAVVEIRKNSSSGTPIPFTASVTDHKEITLYPYTNLEKNRTYYVIIREGTLQNTKSTTDKNLKQVFYFTTIQDTPIPSPNISCSDVNDAGSQEISLRFSSALLNKDTQALTSEYLAQNIKLLKGSSSGDPVTFTAAISSDQRVISLKTPDGIALLPNTTYFVTIPNEVLCDASGNKNQALSLSVTSPSPSVTISLDEITKNSADLSVSYNYPGTFTASITGGAYSTPTNITISSPTAPTGSFQIPTISDLSHETEYKVTVSYTLNDGINRDESRSFQTLALSDDSSLESLKIGTQTLSAPSSSDVNVSPTDGKVTITPTVSDSNATLTVSVGENTISGGPDYEVPISGETTVTIKVTAENDTFTNYSFRLIPIAVP